MTSLLPNAQQTFVDANGFPLVGGQLFTYIPGTTVPKTTWQDEAQTITNTNPIILDAAGRATIYGVGVYRTVLKDSLGNEIWDKITAATDAGVLSLGQLMAAGVVSNGPSVSHAPTGNTPTTLGTLVIQSQTASATEREFLVSIGLTSNKANGAVGADKVALYVATVGTAGSTDCWSINSLMDMDPTAPANISFQGYELDFNNNLGNRGSAAGPASISPPVAFGLAVSGASPFTSTAGIVVAGVTTNQWYRGIMFTGSTVYSAISDYSSSTVGLEMIAIHGIGIDMNGSNCTTAIRVPNSSPISAENASNTGAVQLITLNGADAVVIGAGSVGVALESSSITHGAALPGSDNAYSLGAPSARWSSVWSVNGVIQTSDPSLKTDIKPLPLVLPLVSKINPITFRWKSGGLDIVETSSDQIVHADEVQTHELDNVDMVDGKPVLGKRIAETRVHLFDEMPVYDAQGNPVMEHLPEQKEALAEDGSIISPYRAARSFPRMHRVPRMETRSVKSKSAVEKDGKRTHWGFLASDVKAAFDSYGMDFGGYVKGEDGTEALRPDQMIPVLWKAVQELAKEVAALKATRS